MGTMFIKLNLDDDLIELIEEEVDIEGKGVWVDEEEMSYNLGEGYMDFDLIEESDNKVIYGR
jgi:hypothetical protein